MLPDSYLQLLAEYLDLSSKVLDPKVVSNAKDFGFKTKRLNQIREVAEKIQTLKNYNKQLEDNKSLIEGSDTEMSDLATLESEEIQGKLDSLRAEVAEMLKKTDPNDERNVIVEIRAGTGGDEAALFAADLMRMYTRYAENKGWTVKLLNTNYTGNGGFKEVVFSITGDSVFGTLKYESGVHRVQRVPATESSGRIHTSAASVVVLPEVDDLDVVEIRPEDIRVDVFRSSGAGGQHVNKTESAVRITHLPSGIVVACQDERSQLQNKERALSILKSKLYELELQKKADVASDIRKSSIKSGDRSAKIRTYNFPDSRVTDHRVKVTWHNLSEILNGFLDDVISETKEILEKED